MGMANLLVSPSQFFLENPNSDPTPLPTFQMAEP